MRLHIQLVYCTVWHYTERAVGLTADLLREFEPQIEKITLMPSDGGRFEVSVNDALVYSKLETHRHAEAGEVVGLVRKYLKEKR